MCTGSVHISIYQLGMTVEELEVTLVDNDSSSVVEMFRDLYDEQEQ